MDVKAVILCAGKGSRLCPLTPFIPKEMLPIAGFPTIHHVLAELNAAGIKKVMIVLSQGKESVRAYCSDTILPKGCIATELSLERDRLLSEMEITFAEQKQLLGTADAVYLARDFMGKEPLLAVYPDDLLVLRGLKSKSQGIKQMLSLAHRGEKSVVLCEEIAPENASQYGVLHLGPAFEKDAFDVLDIAEKPKQYTENRAFVLVGRMILQPQLVESIAEYPLNDGEGIIPMLRQSAKEKRLVACLLKEKRWDIGSHQGYQDAVTALPNGT